MNAAHLHLLVNHLPVIGTLLAFPLLVFAVRRGGGDVVKAALVAYVALALLGVGTFLTGEPAEEVVEGLPGITEAVVERHEEAALIATVLLGAVGVLALVTLLRMRRPGAGAPVALLRALLGAALVPVLAMAYTAYLGGQIRHPELRSEPAAPTVEAARDADRAGPLAGS